MASSKGSNMSEPNDRLDYAPAAGSIHASSTIHTSSEGLDARLVEIDSGDRTIQAYAARPADRIGAPLMLVLSEAFGLHEHVADIVRRFAKLGYFAVAPDLMVRQGDPMAHADIAVLVGDLLLKIPDAQVMSDLDATVDWARAADASLDHLFATGFCWGGRWTWLYAAHRRLDAAVAWYGIVDGRDMFPDDGVLFPRHPLDLKDDLKAPVLGLYGGRDEAIPLATIHAMEARLADGSPAARSSRIHVYPDAGHAFFADYRDSYRADLADDAWRRCTEWLSGHTSPCPSSLEALR
jgi:carboxymethylenebutenolidase